MTTRTLVNLQSDSFKGKDGGPDEQREGLRVEQNHIGRDAVIDQGRDLICADVYHCHPCQWLGKL